MADDAGVRFPAEPAGGDDRRCPSCRRCPPSEDASPAPADNTAAARRNEHLPQLRRSRHRDRPRHRQHARLRARPGDRRVRAVGGGDRLADRRRAGRRRRGEAHDRPHARVDLGDPAAAPRRDRRLRGHRADAALLHPAGGPAPDGAAAARDVRAVGRDRGGEEGGGRRVDVGRRAPGAPDRGADRRGHRRRPADRRAGRATWSWTSAAAPARWP